MSETEPQPVGFFEGAWTWLWPTSVTGIGTVGLCVWPLVDGKHFRLFHHNWSWPVAIAIASAVVLLIGQLWTARELHRLARIRRERDRATERATLAEDQLHLAMSAGETGLGEHLAVMTHRLALGPAERVTLYRVDAESKQFVRAARFCTNVVWKSGGREEIPMNEGVLAWALADSRGEWRAGFRFRSETARVDVNVRDGNVPAAVAESLRMPSREYFVKTLVDPATGSFGAVVVFESTQIGGIDVPAARRELLHTQEPIMRTMAALASVTIGRRPGAHRATSDPTAML